MVKVLTAGGRNTDLPIGPVYFRETMSDAAGLPARHIRRGGVASFSVHIGFSGDKRTLTSACRTASTYLKCPSIS